ncbi:unnamed protein product [Urochloa humidicola]
MSTHTRVHKQCFLGMKLLKYTMKWLKRTKPREGNELVSSDQSQDKLEKASDTSMPTNRSDSLENKPTGSPDTTPRKLAIKLAFTVMLQWLLGSF